MCYADKTEVKSSGTVSSPLKSSLSGHLLLQPAPQSDVVSNSGCTERTSANVASSHTQLMKQLSDTSAALHLRTLGFEAMTVLVKHLSEQVADCQ